MSREVLAVRNISKSFGGVHAVQDVSFSVEEGTVHGLIGPNGAGKTTCFNMIAGALAPSRGSVIFDDADITGWPSWKVSRRGISRTFQNIRVFSELTVSENVYSSGLNRSEESYLGSIFGTRRARRHNAETREHVVDLVERLHLTEYLDTQAGELPIGIQRRVEIARALALRPKLLLLDEPTAGMNSSETANIAEIVRGLRGDVTVLLVEHDMSFVMKVCDRLSVLDRGEIISEGTPQSVQNDERVIEAYLGRQV